MILSAGDLKKMVSGWNFLKLELSKPLRLKFLAVVTQY